MSEAAKTLDGWYSLHLFQKVNWTTWKKATVMEKQKALSQFHSILKQGDVIEQENKGSHALYTILGHKADFLIMFVRPTLQELHTIEQSLQKMDLSQYIETVHSYVSVVELSNYLPEGENPYENPQVRARLYPILPKSAHICFYPMNKRRSGDDNWYMLPMEERRKLMASHGRIGRQYAGIVKQIITGSVGFDDYEWGVTLFSEDALQFKKLVYEMRFDEVSARYGEFGSFFIGNLLLTQDLQDFFATEKEALTV